MPFSLFTFIYLAAVTAAFYIVHGNLRKYVLLLASVIYISRYSIRAGVWMILTSLAVYLVGMLIEKLVLKGKHGISKVILILTVSCSVVLFAVFKYTDHLPVSASIAEKLIIPIGFSYYIFQAISYLVDIHQKKTSAERNPADFMLYMCFFPKFISGPIERSEGFLEQVHGLSELKLFEYDRISSALLYMLYGFVLKVAIADRLGLYTANVMAAPESYGSLMLFFVMLGYTMQIYCDFSGYTLVAIGVGRLFGIELSQNFNAPYLAANISDFWRRWHMSLSSWLRDYVYIPLGGNRKGFGKKCLNLMIVFVLCGLWHGGGIHFVLWGILHGLYSVVYALWSRQERSFKLPRMAGTVITFFCASFAWLLFGITDMNVAASYIFRMFAFRNGAESMLSQMASVGMNKKSFVLIPLIAIVIFMDVLSVRHNKNAVDALRESNYRVRYVLIYLMVILLFLYGIYGPGYNTADFMYMSY